MQLSETRISDLSFEFAVNIVELYKILINHKEYVISKQLLRSATSIAANVQESTAAQSKTDFIHKMCIASKEARETRFWLLLLNRTKLVETDYTHYLQGIESIIKVLTKIIKTSQNNLKSKT